MDVDVNMRKRKIFNSYQDLIYFINNNNNLINIYKNVKMVLSTIKWYNTKIINEKPIIFFEYDDKNIRVALFTCRLTPIKKMVLDTNGNRILKESDLDWPDYKRAQMIFIFNTSFNFWNYVIQNLIKINDFINISVSYNEFVILQKVLASDKFEYSIVDDFIDARSTRMRIILPKTFEELLEPFKTKKHHQYNMRNINRIIKRANLMFNIQYHYIDINSENIDKDIESYICDISYIHSHSWQCGQCYFNENINEIVRYLYYNKCLLMLVIYANDVPVSYVVSYRQGNDVLEYWTAYNNDYFKYSFGRIAFISYIKKCIETGVKSIDCCGTIHKYKLDLVNDIKKMYEINIFTKSQIGRRLKHVKCLYPQSML